MNAIAGMLSAIPSAVWAYIGGVVSTIVITNRHERRMRKIEREMSFRKEIFVEVAEALHIGMTTISRFGNIDIPHEEVIADFIKKSPAFGKAQLVGNIETLEPLSALSTEMAETFFDLSSERNSLVALQRKIVALEAARQGPTQAQAAMIEMMRHHNIEQIDDQARFQSIRDIFDFETQHVSDINEQLAGLRAELYAKHLRYIQTCFAENVRIARLTPPVLVAARKELDLPLEGDRYEEMLRSAQERMEGHIADFINKLTPK